MAPSMDQLSFRPVAAFTSFATLPLEALAMRSCAPESSMM